MRRVALATVIVVLAACTTEAAPPTTEAVTTTTTTTPTTTTTLPPSIAIKGAGDDLTDLVVGLYIGRNVNAPTNILRAFGHADGALPAKGKASIARWNKNTRLAVVVTGKDVTLAVADPEWRIVGGWWPSMSVEQHLGSFPKIVAVVGSDARPGQNRNRTRSDSIHFVALDGKGTASMVGLPRDSWVPIPGHGTNKVNAALYYGGPPLMMETFANLTGLDLDGHILTGFAGFQEMIEILGGLKMNVPQSFNDQAAHAFIEAGKQILGPAQALGLSRTRKTLSNGDFSRQANGGLVLIAAQTMVKSMGPIGLPDLLASAHPYFSTSFEPGQLLVLAAAITRVKPKSVRNVVAPGSAGTAGIASVVYLHSSAADLWKDLADGRLHKDG